MTKRVIIVGHSTAALLGVVLRIGKEEAAIEFQDRYAKAQVPPEPVMLGDSIDGGAVMVRTKDERKRDRNKRHRRV